MVMTGAAAIGGGTRLRTYKNKRVSMEYENEFPQQNLHTWKPDKYAIHFYAFIGHTYVFFLSMLDNRAGNKTGVLGVQGYCQIFFH